MTTEIAVLNKHAVALAADSAGTVHVTDINGKRDKVYFSENKLFALSKYHPVGVLVFQSSEFMGIPIEIIIKEYRRSLGKTFFPTLEEYAKNFLDYLLTDRRFCFADAQERFFNNAIISFLKDMVALYNKIKSVEEFVQEVEKTISDIQKVEDIPNISPEIKTEIHDKYAESINDLIRKNFPDKLSDEIIGKLVLLFELLITKQTNFPRGKYTGIVFAGYGENEIFPSIDSYQIFGFYHNLVKSVRNKNKSDKIDCNNDVSIRSFGQDDVVTTFMEGIDPKYQQVLKKNIQILINDILAKIINKNPELLDKEEINISKLVIDASKEPFEQFNKSMNDYEYENHVRPIIMNSRFLAKDSLAEFAETLVNITSFMRKSTMVAETVGGPVDVAVISKADGFVWIKRKYYFKPELNHQFFNNYFQDGGEKND